SRASRHGMSWRGRRPCASAMSSSNRRAPSCAASRRTPTPTRANATRPCSQRSRAAWARTSRRSVACCCRHRAAARSASATRYPPPETTKRAPRSLPGPASFSVRSDEAAQHVLEDAAVAVVVGLSRRVDTHDRVELDDRLAGRRVLARLRRDVHRLGGDALVQLLEALDREHLGAVEAERVGRLTLGEL